jgi:hypothetical protein
MLAYVDLLKISPIATVPLPSGYEVVWVSDNGSYFTDPVIAVTFQNDLYGFDEEVGIENGYNITLSPKLWCMTMFDGVEEIDQGHKQFVGIKRPGQSLDNFVAVLLENRELTNNI